jgi:hypothetical protein
MAEKNHLTGWDHEAWNRRTFRWGVAVLLVFTALNTLLNFISIMDRRRIHAAEQVTQERLDARAEVHILLIRAYVKQRPLTVDERHRILELWEAAKYPERLKDMLHDIEVDPEPLVTQTPQTN